MLARRCTDNVAMSQERRQTFLQQAFSHAPRHDLPPHRQLVNASGRCAVMGHHVAFYEEKRG
jgi:hypothetical protein